MGYKENAEKLSTLFEEFKELRQAGQEYMVLGKPPVIEPYVEPVDEEMNE